MSFVSIVEVSGFRRARIEVHADVRKVAQLVVDDKLERARTSPVH